MAEAVKSINLADAKKMRLVDGIAQSTINLRTDLKGADLSGVDLSGLHNKQQFFMNLEGANLRGANFKDLDMRYANLTNADITGANITETNLSHAILLGTKGLESCIGLATASFYEIKGEEIDLRNKYIIIGSSNKRHSLK